MDEYYKYHCGVCGTEWTKDDEQFVKGMLAQKHESLKSEVEKRIESLQVSYDSDETPLEDKASIRNEITKGKEVLKKMVEHGPDDHEDYMNGVNCPRCGSSTVSGQEKE